MKNLLLFLFLFCAFVAKAQVSTDMPVRFLKTLPSTCDPTRKSDVLVFHSTNQRFYVCKAANTYVAIDTENPELDPQTAGTVYAAPSGATGVPVFRLLTSTDIPVLPASKIVDGSIVNSRCLRIDGTGKIVVAGADCNAIGDATAAAKGQVRLSATPTVSSDPVAVGTNDTLVQTIRQSVLVSDYADLAAAVSAIGVSEKELIIAAPVNVTANLLVPEKIRIRIIGNGALNISTGVTLTIENGASFSAPNDRQIFTGAGIPYFSKSLPARIYPEWFGAKGDNTTDDSAAFAKLYQVHSPTKSAVYWLALGKTYYQGTTPFEPDAPFHLTSDGADNWSESAGMRWAGNTPGVIVHHYSTKTGIQTAANALFSRITNVALTGAAGANTHTVNISGLVVTKTSGQDFTSANGYAAGFVIHVNGFPYVVRTVDSSTQLTLYKPRLYVDVTNGSTQVTIGDYNSWVTTGEWVGQQIKIDGTNYTISNVFNSGGYKMTLSTPYFGSTNLTGGVSGTFSTVSTATDTITSTAHPFITGQKIYVQLGGTLPSPLVQDNYYIIKVDANTVKLATTYANALAGTAIDLTTTGSGTNTLLGTRFGGDAELQGVATTSGLGARANIYNGITAKATVDVQNAKIWSFAGSGIALDSATGLTALPGSAPNNNNSRIQRNSIYYNYGHGIYAKGINSNQCYIANNDLTNNYGAGIYEAGFLGNNYFGDHMSFNYFAAIYGDGAANNSTFFGEYSEGGQPSSKLDQYMMVFSGVHGAAFDPASAHGLIRQEQGLTRADTLLVQSPRANPKTVGIISIPANQQNTIMGFGSTEFSTNLISGGSLNSLRFLEYQLGYDQFSTGWYHFYQGGFYYDSTKTLLAFSGTSASEGAGKLWIPGGFYAGTGSARRRVDFVTAAPSGATGTVGDVAYNKVPDAISPYGWLKTGSSTWTPFGATGIASALTVTANLNFPSISANSGSELTATVTGASVGDNVTANPSTSIEAGLLWNAYVSAANTVTLRVINYTGSPIDPVAKDWKITVLK